VKIEYSMKFALLALCVTFATANAYALECTVDDPTGTPLNVRSRPNGPIVGALHNGATVFVSDLILDGSGRRWAKIVPIEEAKPGWVFREYLMCTSASVPTDRVQAESALDRYCRQAGVTKAEPCVEVARDCGKPTEYAMVADRTCMAADIVTCWNRGLRPGAKLDACVDEQARHRATGK
jgi:hypothetical protein